MGYTKYLLLLLTMFCLPLAMQAQDTLFTKKYKRIICKVNTITEQEITYTKAGNTTEETISTSLIDRIVFDNGSIEDLALYATVVDGPNVIDPSSSTNTFISEDMWLQGTIDANNYFRSNRAFWGTFVVTLLYPPVGLATGVVINLTRAKVERHAPHLDLLNNDEYFYGFKHRMKQRRGIATLAGFGSGILVWAGTIVAILSLVL